MPRHRGNRVVRRFADRRRRHRCWSDRRARVRDTVAGRLTRGVRTASTERDGPAGTTYHVIDRSRRPRPTVLPVCRRAKSRCSKRGPVTVRVVSNAIPCGFGLNVDIFRAPVFAWKFNARTCFQTGPALVLKLYGRSQSIFRNDFYGPRAVRLNEIIGRDTKNNG